MRVRIRSARALSLIVLLFAGCVIPTPEFDTPASRSNIKDTKARFEPGRTTREELIVALGEPDAVSPDERRLVYRSEKVCCLWFAARGYGGVGDVIKKDRYLVLELDENHVLTGVRSSSTWFGSRGKVEVLKVPTYGTVQDSNFDATALPGLQGRLQKSYHGWWFPNVEGYDLINVKDFAILAGRLLLTDSHLYFLGDDQPVGAEPLLSMAYESIAEIRLDRFGFSHYLVVRTRGREVQTVVVAGPRGIADDRDAMEEVRQIVLSRMGPDTY